MIRYRLLAESEATPGALAAQGLAVADSFENAARFDGHIRVYPVLRCNLKCAYCVNEAVGATVKKYTPAPAESWAQALNRENRHVVLTGGEPFLHKDLEALVNAIRLELKVRVYTNLCLDLAERLGGITRPVHFYVSWHPGQNADRERFLANLAAIDASEHLSRTVHAIEAPETRQALEQDMAWFAERGLAPDLDPDQRTFAGACQDHMQPALCRRNILLLGPDGARYQCVSKLMRAKDPLENIFHGPLKDPLLLSLCPEFGRCAPCDQLGETRMDVLRPASQP